MTDKIQATNAGVQPATDLDTHFYLAGWNGARRGDDSHRAFRAALRYAPASPAVQAAPPAPAAVAVPSLTPDEARWAAQSARLRNGPSDTTQPGEYAMAGALALAAKLAAAAPAQEHATQLAGQGQKKCVCTFAQRVLGDGCRHCNPQEYIDRLHKCLDEYREEADTPAQAQEDARDALTLEELNQLDRAIEHFVEGEDTDVDWRLLTRAACLGFLECERFTVPPSARAAIDAARAAQGGAA